MSNNRTTRRTNIRTHTHRQRPPVYRRTKQVRPTFRRVRSYSMPQRCRQRNTIY